LPDPQRIKYFAAVVHTKELLKTAKITRAPICAYAELTLTSSSSFYSLWSEKHIPWNKRDNMQGTKVISAADLSNAVAAAAEPVSGVQAEAPAPLPAKPKFPALKGDAVSGGSRSQYRRIPVPPNRLTPLKTHWMEIYEPVVKQLKLQIRMNLRPKSVELKTSPETADAGALQKGEDFVRAFLMGFAVRDAIALVRLDDLYLESFEVQDVRSTLKGDHLARAVGRIAGKDGKTKFTIENATKTRIVVADTKIHILGSYENTRLARHAIGSLILGAAPGKVYNKLRNVSARLNERF
jgi:RNA-binding protein PNO1